MSDFTRAVKYLVLFICIPGSTASASATTFTHFKLVFFAAP